MMINVQEVNLKDVSEWRTELVNELAQLRSDIKTKEQQLKLLENKTAILAAAVEKFPIVSDGRKLFWEEYGEPVEKELSEKSKEFTEFKQENYKKQEAIEAIIHSIETHLNEEGFKF